MFLQGSQHGVEDWEYGYSLENFNRSRLNSICTSCRCRLVPEIHTENRVTTESGKSGTKHETGRTGTNDYNIVFRLLDGIVVRGVVVLVWEAIQSRLAMRNEERAYKRVGWLLHGLQGQTCWTILLCL